MAVHLLINQQPIEVIYLDIMLPKVILFFIGIIIVRPTQRGIVERLANDHHFANVDFHWIIPVINRLFAVNATEQVVDAEPQEIIQNDNANECKNQVVNGTRTTSRSIRGTLTLSSANSERRKIMRCAIIPSQRRLKIGE